MGRKRRNENGDEEKRPRMAEPHPLDKMSIAHFIIGRESGTDYPHYPLGSSSSSLNAIMSAQMGQKRRRGGSKYSDD